jgi:ribosome-binding factor A
MSKLRINRVNNLLKEELSWIIQRELDYSQVGFVTITKVRVSPDLKQAKVYVSFINKEEDKEKLKVLKESVSLIKKFLAQRTKLRFVPELRFYKDNTLEEVERINELFDKIKNVEEEGNSDE